jgi:two-component system sensor histidine kinase DegS
VPALRHLARTATGAPRISISVAPEVEAQLRTLPSDIAVGLYRAAREAVSNSLAHADPASIQIQVGLAADTVVMQVEDDGTGFDLVEAEREGRAMGLFTMRERIGLLNGQVEISSRPSLGTSVSVRVPVDLARRSPPTPGPEQLESTHAR